MTEKMASLVKGMIMGLTGKADFNSTAEPTAYLYNGVQLPKLPEWDKGAYPYAVIRRIYFLHGDYYRYYFMVLSASVYKNTTSGWICLSESGIYKETGSTKVESTEWSEFEEETAHDGGSMGFTDAFWTNTDILDADGNLYLAASEPVPIYE